MERPRCRKGTVLMAVSALSNPLFVGRYHATSALDDREKRGYLVFMRVLEVSLAEHQSCGVNLKPIWMLQGCSRINRSQD
jgi:hypothetical protein